MYLVGGSVEVGESHVEQVVLQGVDPGGNGQLQRVQGLVEDLLAKDAVQGS